MFNISFRSYLNLILIKNDLKIVYNIIRELTNKKRKLIELLSLTSLISFLSLSLSNCLMFLI